MTVVPIGNGCGAPIFPFNFAFIEDKDAGAAIYLEGIETENPVRSFCYFNSGGISKNRFAQFGIPTLQIYPNPFTHTTNARFQILQSTYVNIDVYNISGQLVRSLLNDDKLTGSYNVMWDGKDLKAMDLPGGVYFLKFKVGDYTETKKLILFR
jgi:hypothetical protein